MPLPLPLLRPDNFCSKNCHSGEYSQVDGKPKCFMAKTCPDCGAYVTDNKHEFGEWKSAEMKVLIVTCVPSVPIMKCRQSRTCIHCGYEEIRIRHSYEEQGKDEKCRLVEVCKVCNNKKFGQAEHNWIKIPFINKDFSMQEQKKCKDCGFIES